MAASVDPESHRNLQKEKGQDINLIRQWYWIILILFICMMRNLTQLLLFMLQNENDCGDLGSVEKQEDEQQQMEGGEL